MAIRYTLVETNSTDVPGAAGATYNRGFNIPGGAVSEIIVRIQGTMNAVGDLASDTGSIIAALRVVLNGETFFDFRNNFGTNATTGASATSVFMNAMGRGRSLDVNSSTTARDYFLRIPVGRNVPAGISRLEYTIQYSALGGAFTGASSGVGVTTNSPLAIAKASAEVTVPSPFVSNLGSYGSTPVLT